MKKFTVVQVRVSQRVGVAQALTVALYLIGSIGIVSIVGGTVLQFAFSGGKMESATADSTNSVTLAWTAPGNDADVGTAATYDVRYSTEPLAEETWLLATQAQNPPIPLPAGSAQSMTVTGLAPGTIYSFAIKTTDDAGNESSISNVATKRTDVVECTPDWSCTAWTECRDGVESRTCTDVSQPACGTDFAKPIERQTCTTPQPDPVACVEQWSCTEWSACVDGAETRSCQDLEQCGTETSKPATMFDCSSGGPEPETPMPTYLLSVPARGGSPEVKVFDASTGKRISRFMAYSSKYRGGLSVAGGDVDRDGEPEVVVGTGTGNKPEVSVFTLRGKLKFRFYAFPSKLRTGVNVAVADVDGNGSPEIITSPAGNYTTFVRVYQYDGAQKKFTRLVEFGALRALYKGGANISGGDLDRDGFAEVIASPTTFDRRGSVEVYEYDLLLSTMKKRHSFSPYGSGFRNGIETTVGDVDGDGNAELITVPAPGATDVHAYAYVNNSTKRLGRFFAASTSFRGGADVTSFDVNQDGKDEILTVTFSNGPPGVRVFGFNSLKRNFGRMSSPFPEFVYSASFRKGVRISSM